MGRRKAGEENVRKLQRTGEDGGSYMITLPKELVEKLKWRKGQKLTIQKYKNELTIKDWK